MNDPASVMSDYEEAIENTEGERRHREEIHPRDCLTMIIQKSSPSLCRLLILRCLPHPALHGSLRRVEAQHLQFTVKPRCAPRWVLRNHAKNEIAELSA
jgi:hypothetical protein